MRTTLTIEDKVFEEVRRRAFEQRRTLGDVVNEALRRGLAEGKGPRQRVLGAFVGEVEIDDDFDDLGGLGAFLDEPIEPIAGPAVDEDGHGS